MPDATVERLEMTKWGGGAALAATAFLGLGLIAGSLPNHALAHGDEEHGAGAETFAAGDQPKSKKYRSG